MSMPTRLTITSTSSTSTPTPTTETPTPTPTSTRRASRRSTSTATDHSHLPARRRLEPFVPQEGSASPLTIRWNEMKPPARIRLLIALAVVTTATASCGGSGGSSASTRVGCSPSGAAASANSADYRYVLSVGPTEEMYSRSQVTASHPKTGEVMLNGAMSMAQGPGAQHLEVHICSRHGGDVVVGAPPSITVTDVTAKRGSLSKSGWPRSAARFLGQARSHERLQERLSDRRMRSGPLPYGGPRAAPTRTRWGAA